MSVVVGIGIGQNTVFQANTVFRKVAQAPRLSIGSLHKAATIEVARTIVRIASKKGKRKQRKRNNCTGGKGEALKSARGPRGTFANHLSWPRSRKDARCEGGAQPAR